MESSEDKHWASKYLLDPLNAPEPSQETGPGTHHNASPPPRSNTSASRSSKSGPTVATRPVPEDQKPTPKTSVRSSNNPYRKDTQSSTGYPSPPPSASPRNSRFPDFDPNYNSNRVSQASTQIPTSTNGQNASTVNGSTANGPTAGRRSRGSSLGQRHPGDQTHRPLDMLREEAKIAHRAPHLRKKHIVGADSIDVLDNVGPPGINAYHHEGPYDATLLARNTSYTSSPLEAVTSTNEEALRATPQEMIEDSVTKHRPLDGTAMVPPGMPDRYGRVMHYQEGPDMMIDGQPGGGAYRRWPGVTYSPDDYKGKGEPSFSIEKALKSHRRNISEPVGPGYGIEMSPTSPSTSGIGRSSSHRVGSMAQALHGQHGHQSHHRRPLSVDGTRGGAGQQRYSDWERERARDGSKAVSGVQAQEVQDAENAEDAEGEAEASASASALGRSDSVSGKLRKRFGSLKVRGRNGSGGAASTPA